MKVAAYTALHYGREYLGWAIRSVIDVVDEYIVLYSPTGSHGTRTDRPCPETRDELYAIAKAAAGDKLRWIDGHNWRHEGQQRDAIYQHTDADAILVLDADEIWNEALIVSALLAARYEQARYYRAPMIHYWRSFYRAVVDDPAFPIRLILPKVRHGEDTLRRLHENSVINHFGYAQTPQIVEYKQHVHGHRGEWRGNWYRDRFLVNSQVDCHPTSQNYWFPQRIDPMSYLPAWMATHPYFGLEVIG